MEIKGLRDQLALFFLSEEEEDKIIPIFSLYGSVYGEAMN